MEQTSPKEQPAEQPAEERRAAEQMPPLNAVELLQWCVSVLVASAWQNLGLVPNPATSKIERNLEDARLAIDATASLIEHLKPRLADSEQRELDTLLTNLRLNFVEQKSKA